MDDLQRSKGSFVAAALKVPEDRFEEGRAADRILFTYGHRSLQGARTSDTGNGGSARGYDGAHPAAATCF